MLLNGCAARGTPEPRAYFGPTESLDQIIARINTNNQRIPTLGGKGHFEAWIRDGRREQFVNGEVIVLYSSPMSLRLVGTKDIAGQVFEIGSNDEQYWLIVRGDEDTMWWGRHDNAERIDPATIPVRPDKVIEVLGVQSMPTDLLREPTPTLRFNHKDDAYMLTWNELRSDRWVIRKEIWYDRRTLWPTMVLIFDDNGRVVLRAYLSNHKPIRIEGDSNPGPTVATRYDISFPQTRSQIILDLNTELGLKRGGAPNERSFIFPGERGERAGVSHVIPLDPPATQPR